MNFIDRAHEILDIELQGLHKVRDELGPPFVAAVELSLDRLERGAKLVVTGVGKSLLVAQKISATLASTGSTSVVLEPMQALHGDLGILSGGDVLLALSYSGESEELVRLVPQVKRLDVSIIAMTGCADSALALCSDVVIPVPVAREACPFNMAPTTSTTAMMAVGDALAIVLLEARGFQREDYAKLHPGGAIGRALLVHVADIMRTGERLASVPDGATVKDTVIAMTAARAGQAGIVDGDGRLLGIFTDGDLRRHLAGRSDVMDLPITEVMTPSPISVRASQLAVDVLRTFEDHNIDDLLVMDDDGLLVGAIDIQDLPKLKIL